MPTGLQRSGMGRSESVGMHDRGLGCVCKPGGARLRTHSAARRAAVPCLASRARGARFRGGNERRAMDEQTIRTALERHWSDIDDQEVVHELYHDDVVLEFPQGGERLVGLANV